MSDEEAQINFLLREFLSKVEGSQSIALISREGLFVAGILEEGTSEMHIAALSMIAFHSSERLAMEIKGGEIDILIIQTTDKKILITECGYDYCLITFVDEDSRLDLAFMNLRQTSNRLLDILED